MKKMLIMLLAVCMLLTVAACGTQGSATAQTDVTTLTGEDAYTSQIELLDEDMTYYVDIEIADYGTVTVQLDQSAAPITAANFVTLAENGFYNGLTFHRIISGFMVQGGDPKGNGTGGSDVKIKGEFSANGWDNPIKHERGVISMARSKAYDSASSQFFIMHADAPHLDGGYAAFGHVTEGMDVVDAICAAAKPMDNNGSIAKENQPVITSVTVRAE
ncbi:MAG: peptidylprolyl isomerase [Oscillospiraceae bacterium]|nr:peptidylprolyl isomerase [Oscillospiraceae bacterium]